MPGFPRPVQLTFGVGNPIEVPKVANPTAEQVAVVRGVLAFWRISHVFGQSAPLAGACIINERVFFLAFFFFFF